jgi:hypothetical protein
VTRIRLVLISLFYLSCSGVAHARGEIVLQRSTAALELATAIAAELRALGIEVHNADLSAKLPDGAAVTIVCAADTAPVEVRFMPDSADQVVHVVSGMSANESAIRVSEIVRAQVLTDSLRPQRADGGFDGGGGRATESGTSSWHDEEDSDAPGDSGPIPMAAAVSEPDAKRDEPVADVSAQPPRRQSEDDDRVEEASRGEFETALTFGAAAFVWASDLPPALSLEAGFSQSFWGWMTLDLRAGIPAVSTSVTGYVEPLEMTWAYLGADLRFRLFTAGPFSVDGGVGASGVRFEFTGESGNERVGDGMQEEWTPWIRASAIARVALVEHVGLYFHGNVGSLLTELRIYGPGSADFDGAPAPDGSDVPLGTGARGGVVLPEDQGPWGLMGTVGPAVLQVGLGLEATWEL